MDRLRHSQADSTASQSIDWYSQGESRSVEVGGVRVTVRFVGRNGRRSRIAIIAPPGAVFSDTGKTAVAESADGFCRQPGASDHGS